MHGNRLRNRGEEKSMTANEAYSVISRAMVELACLRQQLYPKGNGWSGEETMAQVIAFEALRRMGEEEHETDRR